MSQKIVTPSFTRTGIISAPKYNKHEPVGDTVAYLNETNNKAKDCTLPNVPFTA